MTKSRWDTPPWTRGVDRFASELLGVGVQTGSRVAMALLNGVDIVVGFLACMRLGAIWVGINPKLGVSEQHFKLGDSGAAVALVLPGSPILRSLPESDCQIIAVDEEFARSVAAQPLRTAIRAAVDPHAPAAISYTSGTTGRPKGGCTVSTT
ncbi:AMP-binding protein [Nocardia sp. NPDC005366]|uniref:AMP-binding protein n=1 Tax=Nocardia sp. NPDC005366 TaxID=3156878 RepID=UPI0033B30F86